MSRSIAALAACLLFSGVVLAGCGGGDDQGTTTGSGTTAATSGDGQAVRQTSITKAELVAKANGFCTKQMRQLKAKLRQSLEGTQGSQKAAYQQKVLRQLAQDVIAPAMQAEAEELRTLGAPAGDEEQVQAIAEALEAIAAEGREDPAGLVANAAAFTKAQALAGKYDLGSCGRTV